MRENYPDTAREGFTTMRWYDVQMEGALSLLGTTKLDVESYGSLHVREGDSSSPKFLRIKLRSGREYRYYNFEGFVQVVEVTTDEQLAEQDMLLQLLFG